VSDPSVVVTSAAYLLFYRRRSKVPLGGPRFSEIFQKFDRPNQSGDDSDTEIGEDDRSDEAFGRSRPDIDGKQTAFRTRSDRELPTATVTPLVESDEDDGADEPPQYHNAASGASIQPSIEDEGVDMADHDHLVGANPLTQDWSFSGLAGDAHHNSVVGDGASDEAQFDLTDDERHTTQQLGDQDIDMKSFTTRLSDADEDRSIIDQSIGASHPEGRACKNEVPIPAVGHNSDGSDEVTEIHVEGDNEASSTAMK
jgi:ubiquitin carboxyl-terminal hydrolase 4/11/15